MACACGKGTCGCSAPKIVHLMDEHGTPHEFYIADKLRAGSDQYVFLVSLANSEQYALLRIHTDELGQETYQNIENEQEWERIQRHLFNPVDEEVASR